MTKNQIQISHTLVECLNHYTTDLPTGSDSEMWTINCFIAYELGIWNWSYSLHELSITVHQDTTARKKSGQELNSDLPYSEWAP